MLKTYIKEGITNFEYNKFIFWMKWSETPDGDSKESNYDDGRKLQKKQH